MKLHTIVSGRIVYPKDRLPDPNGVNDKIRGYVVISTGSEIAEGEPYWCVAITSKIYGEPDEVVLPWSKNGDSLTGLTKESVAKACWQEWAYKADFTASSGFVKPTLVERLRMLAQPCCRTSRSTAIDDRLKIALGKPPVID